jgi:hypothetical protein
MKREINQIVVLALAAAFFLGISSARAADETPVGKIQRIYVEANRGLAPSYAARSIAPAPLYG